MELLNKFFYDKEFFRDKNVRLIGISIAAILLFVVAFFAYKWYQNSLEQRAQKAFSDSMEVYKQALNAELSKGDEEGKSHSMWDEVEIAFKTAYLQNKSSSLAPFLLIYESEALIRQGKKEEGYKILVDAVSKMSKSSPYYYFYKIKQSLMEFDMNEIEKAIKDLEKLSNDKANPFKDLSLYYLGEYYWSMNEFEKAKECFQRITTQKTDEKIETPWKVIAESRLQQLSK